MAASSSRAGDFAMSGRVVVVGSVNVDLVALVERLPSPGETVTGGRFERHEGGKSGNQAVAAARLGADVAFVGAVGDDPFGAEARAALAAEGIDVRGLATLAGVPTGVALIVVDAAAENAIAVASGANGAVTAAAVGGALEVLAPRPGDIVIVGTEIPIAAAAEALRIARAAGATTVLNPAPATGVGRDLLAAADIVTPNRTELRQIAEAAAARTGRPRTAGAAGAAGERWARELLDDGPDGPGVGRAIVVTLGTAGALVVERGETPGSIVTTDVPAHRVAAVDTTGAGDTFSGALAAALAEGRSLVDAVRWAGAAAALSTTRAGAREGMPDRATLEAFLVGPA